MYALISPNEPTDGGFRVAEVAVNTFEVANPLFWVECAEEVVADLWYYDPSDSQIKAKPVLHTPSENNQPVVLGAQSL